MFRPYQKLQVFSLMKVEGILFLKHIQNLHRNVSSLECMQLLVSSKSRVDYAVLSNFLTKHKEFFLNSFLHNSGLNTMLLHDNQAKWSYLFTSLLPHHIDLKRSSQNLHMARVKISQLDLWLQKLNSFIF